MCLLTVDVEQVEYVEDGNGRVDGVGIVDVQPLQLGPALHLLASPLQPTCDFLVGIAPATLEPAIQELELVLPKLMPDEQA